METKNYFSTDAAGNILPSATCYLYIAGTTDLATGITNINDAPLANPFTAQTSGLVQFKAPNGEYDLRVTKGGRDFTIRIQCFDASDLKNAGNDPSKGAELIGWDGSTVGEQMNLSKKLLNYYELRAYTGSASIVEIVDILLFGSFFKVSNSPTGFTDNNGETIIGANGWVWIRSFSGSLKVSWFGASGDGSNESTKIQAAVDRASVISAGNQTSEKQSITTEVVFDSGKMYEGTITLKKGVSINLDGSTLKAPNGSNSSVIEGQDYRALTGTNSGLGVWNYGVKNGTLDGNMANNPAPAANSGHGLAVYGRNFLVENVKSVNCARRGITLEYGTGAVGTSPFNGKAHKLLSDTTGEHGIYLDVSDMHVDDVNVRNASQSSSNTFDGFFANKGVRATNVNVWRGGDTANTHRYAANLSDGCTLYGAHLETSGTANLRMVGDRSKVAGVLSYNLLGGTHALVSGSGHKLQMSTHNGGVDGENLNAVGVRLGDSAVATYCEIDLSCIAVRGGVVNFVNSAGANIVNAGVWLNADSDPLKLGTPHISDSILIAGTGNGSVNKSYKKLPARNGSINGVGITQGTAAELTSMVNRAFANNSSSNAFLLPKATGGDSVYVANISTVPIQIFPAAGDSILGLSVNAADTLAVGASKHYVSHSASQWAGY